MVQNQTIMGWRVPKFLLCHPNLRESLNTICPLCYALKHSDVTFVSFIHHNTLEYQVALESYLPLKYSFVFSMVRHVSTSKFRTRFTKKAHKYYQSRITQERTEFFLRTIHNWNQFRLNLDLSQSLATSKHKLKTMLFQK